MIISASRRTDIPAFYSDWLFNRLRAGEVLVRNPFNFHQVSRIALTRQTVDCIVFWTKNPAPMLPRLKELDRLGYQYYFQFTITAYDALLEQNVPKKSALIATFRELATRIGPERVLWRFDPIVLTSAFAMEYHLRCFARLARQLHGYTHRCSISFLSLYEKCKRHLKDFELLTITEAEKINFVTQLAAIAKEFKIELCACCDPVLSEHGRIKAAKCIDDQLLARLVGQPVQVKKDTNQRQGCGCAASLDIGAYDTCFHGCRYCYANTSSQAVARNNTAHDPAAPLLTGALTGRETVTTRKTISCLSPQVSLF
jgi:DNA repair photolyase